MGDWKGHKRHLLPPIATVIAMNIKDFGFWELGGEKNVPQMGTCSMGWFQVFPMSLY
jgi:hypothetical protein